jgi:hypothetical protein
MAFEMLVLQLWLVELGFSRKGVSQWLKRRVGVEYMVVARRYLKMLNLHLGYMSKG